jgi:hypothetical protein
MKTCLQTAVQSARRGRWPRAESHAGQRKASEAQARADQITRHDVPARRAVGPSGRTVFALAAALASAAPAAHAIEARVSPQALERTLNHQLFKTPAPTPDLPNRYYLRGKPSGGCSVFTDNPQVVFAPDPDNGPSRIVVKVHTHANFGASLHGRCIGVWINIESQVSFVPYAEGESIGFRDARIDKLSDSRELDALLVPFLAKKMPAEMKVNAASLMRTLLVRAPDSTGYTITLQELNIQSMQIEDQQLVVALDAKICVD